MENINLYKFIPEQLSPSLTVFEMRSQFKIRDLEHVGQGHDVQHSQRQIHDLLSDDKLAIVMFALSLTVCEIFTNRIK